MYSIKAISLMTGVKPETLRTWERRFDFLEPSRDESGRRVYSDKDAQKLGLISDLLGQGHPISRLAEMNTQALRALEADQSSKSQVDTEQELLNDLLETLSLVDLDRFRLLVNRILISTPPSVAIDRILSPAMHEIGSRWSEGKLSISAEHALSNILKGELLGIIGTLQVRANGPKLVFATPCGEQHYLGLLMGAYIAAAEGFQCVILGPDIPSVDLADAVTELEAHALVISVVREQSFDLAASHIRQIATRLDPSILFLVGAPASFSTFVGDEPGLELFDRYGPFQRCLLSLR